jgi:signal transduction histidine kinase
MLHRINIIPVITLVAVLLIAIVYRSALLRQSVQELQQVRIHEVSRLSEFYLDDTVNLMRALAGVYYEVIPENRLDVFRQVRGAYPRFTAFYVVNPQGKVVLEDTSGVSLMGFDLSGESFFQDPLSRQGVHFSNPVISLATGTVVVSVALPLQPAGLFDGFLVAELNLDYLQQVINEIRSSEGDITFIVDANGYLVAHPITTWVQEQRHMTDLELVRDAQAGETGSALYFDSMMEKWVYGSAAPMVNGWIVVSKLPVAQALTSLYSLLLVGLLAFLGSLAAFRWAQHYSVQRIRAPITELAVHADALAHGQELDLPQPDAQEFDEAALLRNSFARMVQAVRERTAELEQANRELAEQIQVRQQAEEAVQALNAELEERVADRTSQLELAVEELDAFAYSVSHDLRAPLRGIDGFSQAVLEDYGELLDETGRSYMGHLRESVQRMRAQIDALLNLSRVSRVEMFREPVDLSELAQSILQELRAAEPGRQVTVKIKPNMHVEGDSALLMTVVSNLLDNAWKFTARTQQAVIEMGCEGCGGPNPVFYVRDNGAGFEPSQAHRLFLPFQRLHSALDYEGTGIGLATVQRVIHRHGGRLWAEGAPGQGACFYFTLVSSDIHCDDGENE